MKGIGLVFAGGGGKGAYQIGVWKYLREIGLDRYVRAVSGTSVGALNASFFVGSTYENAERLWLNISEEKILSPKRISERISEEDVRKLLSDIGINSIPPSVLKCASGTIADVERMVELLAKLIITLIFGDYMFSRDGLEQMITEGLDYNTLNISDVPCFVTCLRIPELEIERFELNQYSKEDVTKLLLASSAIPLVFPKEEFEGNLYWDGGIPIVGDNVPVKPIYDMGIEYIFVIHLDQGCIIKKEDFPNAKIIEIVPEKDLGNIVGGTLDFSSDGASKRLDMGYNDAKRTLKPFIDTVTTTYWNQKLLEAMFKKIIEFEKEKDGLEHIHQEIIDEQGKVNSQIEKIKQGE